MFESNLKIQQHYCVLYDTKWLLATCCEMKIFVHMHIDISLIPIVASNIYIVCTVANLYSVRCSAEERFNAEMANEGNSGNREVRLTGMCVHGIH